MAALVQIISKADSVWAVFQLLWATGWRPSAADWGDGVSASCTIGPVVR